MKKLTCLLLVLIMLVLTGCGSIYKTTDDRPRRTEWVAPEPKFELSSYQLALLHNCGLDKEILVASTGDRFTIAIPKFHTGNKNFCKSPNKVGFQYTIVPPGTYYNEDGAQEIDYIVRTLEYVEAENIDNYISNVFKKRLLDSVLSENDYDTERFGSYSEYITYFSDKVNTLFTEPTKAYTTVELTGELNPIRGTRYVETITLGDNTYNLPMETTVFKLSNGNCLCVRAELISANVSKYFETDVLLDTFIMNEKEPKQKDIDAIVGFLESLELDLNSSIGELMKNVIYGDYSTYYKTTGAVKPVNSDTTEVVEEATFDEVETDMDDATVEETFGDPVQQKYQEILNDGATKVDPNKSSTVINGIDDLDTFGGYNDYSTDGSSYYED